MDLPEVITVTWWQTRGGTANFRPLHIILCAEGFFYFTLKEKKKW